MENNINAIMDMADVELFDVFCASKEGTLFHTVARAELLNVRDYTEDELDSKRHRSSFASAVRIKEMGL